MKRIRNKSFLRILSVYLVIELLVQAAYPTIAFGLMSGPSQPEIQTFKSIGVSDLVNLSSGDFQYSLPLMDVGGYPINLIYDGNVSMDQDASWTGLGWNVNVGSINREVRGLPDDFKGDQIQKDLNMAKDWTLGFNTGFDSELLNLGLPINREIGFYYNRYNGFYISQVADLGLDIGGGIGFGINFSTGADGLNIKPRVSFTGKEKMVKESVEGFTPRFPISININSNQGLSSAGIGVTWKSYCKNADVGTSTLASYSFVNPSHTPSIDIERKGLSLKGKIKAGATIFLVDIQKDLEFQYSSQSIRNKTNIRNGYGFMYLEKGNSRSLLDVNREDDKDITESTTNLPVPILTNDIFSINGHGINGTFWGCRSEIGHVHGGFNRSYNNSGNVSSEFGAGWLTDVGTDIRYNGSISTSKVWNGNTNETLDAESYENNLTYNTVNSYDDNDFEPFYFESAGEIKTETDLDYFEKNGGYKAVGFGVEGDGWNAHLKEKLNENVSNDYNNSSIVGPDQNHRDKRLARNQHITYILAGQSEQLSIDKRAKSSHAKNHHIAEFQINKGDGSRYVYGLPSYNTKQVQFSFNVGQSNPNCEAGTVEYLATDRDLHNSSGRNNYYSKTSTPPFVFSWLLTDIISSDYQDLSDNGPSDDDYGSYVRFRYDDPFIYNWRNPTTNVAHIAAFNEGFLADNGDQTGNIIYGEREVYYPEVIETKTHVAVFFTSDRDDAISMTDEDGGLNTGGARLRKLDRIVLYSKAEWNAHSSEFDINNLDITDLASLRSVQEVHFVYDYLLCPNTPNSIAVSETEPAINSAKLTLTKVYFRYGNISDKAAYNSYSFEYNEFNPAYNSKAVDVWGTFKPQASGPECDAFTPAKNYEYPYTTENKSDADQYASAWNLKAVNLPSGARLSIEYESDDYLYVQNKKAMNMFEVVTMSPDDLNYVSMVNACNNANTPEELYLQTSQTDFEQYNRIYFKRRANDEVESLKEFYDKYLAEIVSKQNRHLYYTFMIRLGESIGTYDQVPGYVKLEDFNLDDLPEGNSTSGIGDDFGYFNAGTTAIGYFDLKMESSEQMGNDDMELSPIVKSAMNYTRVNLPKVATDDPDNFQDPEGGQDFFDNVGSMLANASIIAQAIEFVKGPYLVMSRKGYCKDFIPAKSWIRLSEPGNFKLGGGARVKEISIYDQWALIKNNSDSWETQKQGLTYDYKLKSNGIEISSGVATFEPLISKANPWIQPVFLTEERMLVPDNSYYSETPFAASYFPVPQVTYRMVTVEAIKNDFTKNNDDFYELNSTATGKTENEFYTSYDFPTITTSTRCKMERKAFLGGANILSGIYDKEWLTASQGYCVILNDMNGKFKGIKEYSNNSSQPISGTLHLYNYSEELNYPVSESDAYYYSNSDPEDILDSEKSTSGMLNNRCLTIDPLGNVKPMTLGIDWNMVCDFRESKTNSFSAGANADVSSFLALVVPTIYPTVWPAGSYSAVGLRMSSVCKVIRQTGILKEVISFDNGSSVSTRNLAWDSETGAVILTETKNAYQDKYYSFQYPAHWAYEGMGQSYRNSNIVAELNLNTDGSFGNTGLGDLNNLFHQGDEIVLINSQSSDPNNDCDSEMQISIKDLFGLNYSSFCPNLTFGTNGLKIVWVLEVEDDRIWCIDENGIVVGACEDWIENAVTEQYFAKVIKSGRKNLIGAGMGSLVLKENPCQLDGISGVYKNLFETIEQAVSTDPAGLKVISASAQIYRDYWFGYGITACDNSSSPSDCCSSGDVCDIIIRDEENVTVNPFIENIIGNWRPYRIYAYKGLEQDILSRSTQLNDVSNTSESLNLREDGQFDEFYPFWKKNSIEGPWVAPTIATTDPNWQWTNELTMTDPRGNELESRNVLNQFSAVLFGYNNSLVTATANNARLNQIYFDGFEDHYFSDDINAFELPSCLATYGKIRTKGLSPGNAIPFSNTITPENYDSGFITDSEAHTGRYSLHLGDASSEAIIYGLLHDNLDYLQYAQDAIPSDGYQLTLPEIPQVFGPQTVFLSSEEPGSNKFILSFWVKQNSASTDPEVPYPLDFDAAVVSITHSSTNLLAGVLPEKSNVIDGWQQWRYHFDIPIAADGNLIVQFASEVNSECYVDDIRIQPVYSELKSYVYDPLNLRLMAELDDNNYASFYEYDEEGKLARIKRETERGIYTIQESRNSLIKYKP